MFGKGGYKKPYNNRRYNNSYRNNEEPKIWRPRYEHDQPAVELPGYLEADIVQPSFTLPDRLPNIMDCVKIECNDMMIRIADMCRVQQMNEYELGLQVVYMKRDWITKLYRPIIVDYGFSVSRKRGNTAITCDLHMTFDIAADPPLNAEPDIYDRLPPMQNYTTSLIGLFKDENLVEGAYKKLSLDSIKYLKDYLNGWCMMEYNRWTCLSEKPKRHQDIDFFIPYGVKFRKCIHAVAKTSINRMHTALDITVTNPEYKGTLDMHKDYFI